MERGDDDGPAGRARPRDLFPASGVRDDQSRAARRSRSAARDPTLGYWLRNGLGIELVWTVSLLDEVAHYLDTQSWSTIYSVSAQVA